MTRFRFGAPLPRTRATDAPRDAQRLGDMSVLVGRAGAAQHSSTPPVAPGSVRRSSRGASAEQPPGNLRRAAAIHSPATACRRPPTSTPDEAGIHGRRRATPIIGTHRAQGINRNAGKRAGSASPSPSQWRTSSTIASTRRCSSSRSTAWMLRHKPHAGRAARIAALHGAACVAPGMEHRDTG